LSDFVQASRHGRVGHILLDRPKALNALDRGMIQAVASALNAWKHDAAVHAVVIEGAGGKAFCAGGDIRAIRHHALAGEAAEIEGFFADEYALNLAIAEYPKPYISLIDGICMGGGIGLSVHGTFRVTSEAGLFAMPETAIAMFPDVGATYVLPRLPGMLGLYLGLTGTRLSGADAVHAGIATHLVRSSDYSSLRDELARDGVAAIARHAQPLPSFSLAPHRDAIDRCFSASSLAAIFRWLESEDSDWGRETITALNAMSPSSLAWSFAAIRRGASLNLPDALRAELALTRHVTRHADFVEGVRAMVVDKDRKPRWSPESVSQIDPAVIERMLA
jgi:enoyl-CoA hydratase